MTDHRGRQSALHRAADRISHCRPREAHRRRARSCRPAEVADKRVDDFFARHAAAARTCRDSDEGRADRHSRRADVGARSARHGANFSAIIRSFKSEGVSVLLSSHLLERVQSVCDRVALFSRRPIALMGSVGELGREVLGGGYRGRHRGGRRGARRTARAHSRRQRRREDRHRQASPARRPRRAAGSGGGSGGDAGPPRNFSASTSRASRRSTPAISRPSPAKRGHRKETRHAA